MSTRGSFFGIEIGRTGISTSQYGLDLTGHNISNVETAGYTRQRIVQTAYDPYAFVGRFAPLPGHQLVGGGTRVQVHEQIRSAYLDRRFRTESTAHNYWETRSQSLSYVESFFDNVNEKTSINYTMAEFFRAMKILAEDPISGAPRTLMQTTAMDLVQQLNMVHKGLMDLQESENRQVKTKVEEINRMVQDIAVLNKAIYTHEVTGLIANDLRDKRNLLVDQLAEIIDIEYREYPDPMNPNLDYFEIVVDGVRIVNHDMTRALGTFLMPNSIPGAPDVWEVRWINGYDPNLQPVPGDAINFDARNGGVTGGQLKAHLDVRDGLGIRNGQWDPDSTSRGIPYYIEMVNDLARALVKEINDVHIQGWSDNPLYSESGIFFFHEEKEWTTWRGSDAVPNLVTYESATDIFRWNVATQRWENTAGTAWIEQGGDGLYYDETGTEVDINTYTKHLADMEFVWDGADSWRNSGGNIISQDPVTGAYLLDGQPMPFAGFTRDLGNNIVNITAENIRLSEKIVESAYNIACSSKEISRAASNDPEETQRHNNINIRNLYAIFSETNIMVDRSWAGMTVPRVIGSFDDYGTVIRFDLGNTLHSAKMTAETCRLLTHAASNQRTAIAGVSLDEEMVGLVKYQHAYNGASRVITTMDEALDRLINGTGRVGL